MQIDVQGIVHVELYPPEAVGQPGRLTQDKREILRRWDCQSTAPGIDFGKHAIAPGQDVYVSSACRGSRRSCGSILHRQASCTVHGRLSTSASIWPPTGAAAVRSPDDNAQGQRRDIGLGRVNSKPARFTMNMAGARITRQPAPMLHVQTYHNALCGRLVQRRQCAPPTTPSLSRP